MGFKIIYKSVGKKHTQIYHASNISTLDTFDTLT